MIDYYEIRTFHEGDEVAIVRIFEKANANYGGYSLRTIEYWRWNCLARPDVESDGIILAVDKVSKEIVGYVVAGKSGNLWELSYDPEKSGYDIVLLLLEAAMQYLEKVGASSVNFVAPQRDTVVREVCHKLGFAVSPPPNILVSVLDFQVLVSSIANSRISELEKFNESISVHVQNAPSWVASNFHVKINKKGVTVENVTKKAAIDVQIDYQDLSALFFGQLSPLRAFLGFKLKIKPLSKVWTSLKLLSNLKIDSEWAFQLSEFG
jgi:hypothetical protein